MQQGTRDGQFDAYQSPYGYSPSAGDATRFQVPVPNTFVPVQPTHLHPQQPGTVDGINAFFSSAPTQFIGQQFVQGGQQYVQRFQEKIGVLSGSILNYHFAVNNTYVRKKVSVLLTPYLRSWNFTRLAEQIPGGPRFRAPGADTNCPDLYIPLMAFFSYCILGCLRDLFFSKFTTDVMYARVSGGLLGWFVHVCVFKILAYTMSMSSVLSFVESTCYAGYMFVLLTFQLLGGFFKNWIVWLLFFLYCSTCMAVFFIRSLKRLLHHEARHYGGDARRYNHQLLCLAAFQFVLFYFLS